MQKYPATLPGKKLTNNSWRIRSEYNVCRENEWVSGCQRDYLINCKKNLVRRLIYHFISSSYLEFCMSFVLVVDYSLGRRRFEIWLTKVETWGRLKRWGGCNEAARKILCKSVSRWAFSTRAGIFIVMLGLRWGDSIYDWKNCLARKIDRGVFFS